MKQTVMVKKKTKNKKIAHCTTFVVFFLKMFEPMGSQYNCKNTVKWKLYSKIKRTAF